MVLEGEAVSAGATALEPGGNLRTGLDDFRDQFGTPTSLEEDLMVLSSAVLAADRGTLRGEREAVARRIHLTVPVVNIGLLGQHVAGLERILRTLSNDAWRVELVQRRGNPEVDSDWPSGSGKTLLFSGGLDALSAAVDQIGGGAPVRLVSHRTQNRATIQAQDDLVAALTAKGLGPAAHHVFFVSSRTDLEQDFDHDIESSQRTRSLVFLVLGALVARRSGYHDVLMMAENGPMAIHLPFSEGRIGAFSTHTAHPDVLADVEEVFQGVLDRRIVIRNPYVHQTKAEVIATLIADHSELLPIAESCWRNARLGAGVTHCGECIPCYVRRAAVEHHLQTDPTAYGRDPWAEPGLGRTSDDVGRRNLVDLVLFARMIQSLDENGVIEAWPELFSVNIDAPAVIGMYRRFADQTLAVLGRYASLGGLLA